MGSPALPMAYFYFFFFCQWILYQLSYRIEKGVCPGCILSSCLLNLYTVHHVKYRLDESQAGVKIAGRNINNFRYADYTTLMAESEEELKTLLMKMKEDSEKAGLQLNIQ